MQPGTTSTTADNPASKRTLSMAIIMLPLTLIGERSFKLGVQFAQYFSGTNFRPFNDAKSS